MVIELIYFLLNTNTTPNENEKLFDVHYLQGWKGKKLRRKFFDIPFRKIKTIAALMLSFGYEFNQIFILALINVENCMKIFFTGNKLMGLFNVIHNMCLRNARNQATLNVCVIK